MMDERNCATCAHRWGLFRDFWKCTATGHFCENEAAHFGRCTKGNDFPFWEPRRPLLRRIARFFAGTNSSAIDAARKEVSAS